MSTMTNRPPKNPTTDQLEELANKAETIAKQKSEASGDPPAKYFQQAIDEAMTGLRGDENNTLKPIRLKVMMLLMGRQQQ